VTSLVAPSWFTGPDVVKTDGPIVAEVCELAGYAPDPEQRMLLDSAFSIGGNGKLSSFEVALICARQNLKTGFLKQAALGWLYVTDQRLIVWSAHEFRTAQEAFRDMDELCASHPSLSSRVKAVSRGNGDEAIELKSGSRLIFKARTKGGGRGLSGDKVVLDEAYALRDFHMGALLPTLSARPDPQVVYASSAGLADSDVLRAIRDRGRVGSETLTYAEWGDPNPGGCLLDDCDHKVGNAGCVLDDSRRWRLANPALGRRIPLDYIAAERRALPPREFARERLGWWDEPVQAGAQISLASWEQAIDAAVDIRQLRNPIIAVDVAPHQVAASIVACAYDPRVDAPVISLIDKRPGNAWVAPRLQELRDQYTPTFVLNSAGPVGALIPEINSAQVRFHDLRGADFAKACGLFVASANDVSLRHRGEPEFGAAIAGVKVRRAGDGFLFSRVDSSADISPIVAASLALWLQATNAAVVNNVW